MFCVHCGAQIDSGATFCPSCGKNQNHCATPSQIRAWSDAKSQPMKWFQFMIYFGLWASALLNAYSGIQQLTGANYGADADLIYSLYSGLKALDVIVGLGMLALAVFAIYTRFQLAAYRQKAPKLFLCVYLADGILQLFYYLGAIIILPNEVSAFINASTIIATLSVCAIMIWANKVYFKKRAALFCN